MRPYFFASASAPVERYVCLSCRMRNVRRALTTTRRNLQTHNGLPDEEQLNSAKKGHKVIPQSQLSLADRVKSLFTGNATKEPEEDAPPTSEEALSTQLSQKVWTRDSYDPMHAVCSRRVPLILRIRNQNPKNFSKKSLGEYDVTLHKEKNEEEDPSVG